MDATIMADCTDGHFPKIQKPHWVASQETGIPQETLAPPAAGLSTVSRSVFSKGKFKKGLRSRTICRRNRTVNISGAMWERPGPPHKV